MRTVLVVEEEATISEGLKAMIQSSEVDVGRVIACRNGDEACEELRKEKIEVLFTDLSEMDGFELVRRVKGIKSDIRIVVISESASFQYVVQMLRSGIRDYLLKPVEKQQIQDILMQFENEIQVEKQNFLEERLLWKKELKYLLTYHHTGEDGLEQLSNYFEKNFPGGYIAAVLSGGLSETVEEPAVLIEDVEGGTFLCFEAEKLKRFTAVHLSGACAGLSRKHQGIKELKPAYLEAFHARKEAFARASEAFTYDGMDREYKAVPKDFAERFVQQFGTEKMEEGLRQLNRIFFAVKMHHISTDSLLMLLKEIHILLETTYSRILQLPLEKSHRYQNPLTYQHADLFFSEYAIWLRELKQHLIEEFYNYKNKEKIYAAVKYINENYHKNLNMAVLSNYVSMNYSLFSITFKQYMKMNFVKYLKMIRINEAKKLLKDTELKIMDISRVVGYENEKHFMKTFKNICGVSPTEYRRNTEVSIK